MRRSALPRRFYARSALELAPELLGKILVHRSPEGTVAGRIVEVEAYCGPDDLAAHSARGRRTPRNEAMWGPPGRLYVYFVYGMHWCANVVAAPAGCPEAVLLRAVEPLEGLDLARERRRAGIRDTDLLKGPANLCRGFGITGLLNGADLLSPELFVAQGRLAAGERIVRTARIGVDYAGRDARRPWRFLIAGSPAVSKPPRDQAKASGARPR